MEYYPANMELVYLLQTNSAFLVGAAFVVGLMVGSFLNVVIHRLPVMMERDWKAQCRQYMEQAPSEEDSGLSLAKPRSRCPDCGHAIRFYENIPVLSYLWLRGKCRYCKEPISIQYPLVEAAAALEALGNRNTTGKVVLIP